MKASETIKLLQDEVTHSGDPEITVYCPIHFEIATKKKNLALWWHLQEKWERL